MSRPAVVIIACFVSLLLWQIGLAEEQPSLPKFRRVFGSPKDLEELTHGKQRYLPVESTEFERLLEQAQAVLNGVPISKGARIEDALYKARLVGNQLIGSAALKIDHQASQPVLLDFGICNLSLSNVR